MGSPGHGSPSVRVRLPAARPQERKTPSGLTKTTVLGVFFFLSFVHLLLEKGQKAAVFGLGPRLPTSSRCLF